MKRYRRPDPLPPDWLQLATPGARYSRAPTRAERIEARRYWKTCEPRPRGLGSHVLALGYAACLRAGVAHDPARFFRSCIASARSHAEHARRLRLAGRDWPRLP